MSALIEFDRVTGELRCVDCTGREMTLLGPDEWSGQQDAGLLLQGDAEPEPRFTGAALIAINFPTFYDGRGLSLAVLLRTRFGFRGELRAVGDIRPDLLHYLKRCGFDSVLLAEGVSVDFDDPRLAPHAHYYQASVVDPQPVFRRVQRSA